MTDDDWVYDVAPALAERMTPHRTAIRTALNILDNVRKHILELEAVMELSRKHDARVLEHGKQHRFTLYFESFVPLLKNIKNKVKKCHENGYLGYEEYRDIDTRLYISINNLQTMAKAIETEPAFTHVKDSMNPHMEIITRVRPNDIRNTITSSIYNYIQNLVTDFDEHTWQSKKIELMRTIVTYMKMLYGTDNVEKAKPNMNENEAILFSQLYSYYDEYDKYIEQENPNKLFEVQLSVDTTLNEIRTILKDRCTCK